jgi:hypothetical protein
MREGNADEKEVNGMEAPDRLAVRGAVNGRLDLLDGAVFRGGQMTRTADPR